MGWPSEHDEINLKRIAIRGGRASCNQREGGRAPNFTLSLYLSHDLQSSFRSVAPRACAGSECSSEDGGLCEVSQCSEVSRTGQNTTVSYDELKRFGPGGAQETENVLQKCKI